MTKKLYLVLQYKGEWKYPDGDYDVAIEYQGIFENENDAYNFCKEEETFMIMECYLNEKLPKNSKPSEEKNDRKCYYPYKQERRNKK